MAKAVATEELLASGRGEAMPAVAARDAALKEKLAAQLGFEQGQMRTDKAIKPS